MKSTSLGAASSNLAGVMMPGSGCNLTAIGCNDAESGGQYCQKWEILIFSDFLSFNKNWLLVVRLLMKFRTFVKPGTQQELTVPLPVRRSDNCGDHGT